MSASIKDVFGRPGFAPTVATDRQSADERTLFRGGFYGLLIAIPFWILVIHFAFN